MAEESTGGSSFMDTFKQKLGPLPVGVWVLILVIGGGYLWYRHNQTTSATTAAAASQTNSNLGSADQLANSFGVAGTMPYSGGDTYINSVGNGSIGGPQQPQTVAVSPGESANALIAQIQKSVPGFSWADFWALNPNIAKVMKQDPKTKAWTFLKSGTVTISSPTLTNLPPSTPASK